MKKNSCKTNIAWRVWSILLCLVMMLGVLPTLALADGSVDAGGFVIIKKVEQGGTETPPAETFTFELADSNEDTPQNLSYYTRIGSGEQWTALHP